ncbi:MAG TPA: hypothetical protein VK961_07330 [Chthoniobacter sp.]|nr:hypothetical protein [Chthoniobacter sp.]
MSLAFHSSTFRRLFSIALTFLLTSSAVWAGDKAAAKTLAAIPLFAFGGIGVAGTTSNGEVAFHNVLASENAAADFAQILKTGTAQAQCYALLGLRLKDRAAFDEQVTHFASSKQEVQTCAGCMMMKQPMSSVVANIKSGTFDDRGKAGPSKR